MSPPFPITTPRNIRLLYLHNFLSDFRFQDVFLVIYFNQIAGSYAASMTLLALVTMTSAVMDIPTGIFSDRMGRKHTIAIGSVCSTASLACYALADNMMLLSLGAVLSGLGTCFFNGNNTALLYESLKAEKLENQFHHYQGRATGMFQLALGLSALCGGLLASHGLRFLFLLGILPQFLSIFVCFGLREPRIHIRSAPTNLAHLKNVCAQAWGNKRLRLLILGQAISYGAGESTFSFKGAFVNMLWPVWAVGLYRALNHAFGFISFWFAGKVVERIKPPYMLALAEAYWFVTQGAAVLLANVVSPIFMIAENIVYGPFIVARDQLLQDEFTDAQRASMGSVASFAGSILYTIVAVCIGAISDSFGVAAGVGFGACAGALSLPLYVWLFRKHF